MQATWGGSRRGRVPARMALLSKPHAVLALEDGTVYKGYAFGAHGKSVGELVFNTSMTGYQEILTDPSYHGQMVVMTYPHIGNYGCEPDFEEGLSSPSPICCSALIVRAAYEGPLPLKRVSLDAYLSEHKTVGVTDIDTRSLTIHLRKKGAQNAAVFRTEDGKLTEHQYHRALEKLAAYPHVGQRDLIEGVATKQTIPDPDLPTL